MLRPAPDTTMQTDWAGYLAQLEAWGERRVRSTYDRGKLEFMAPSPRHESRKSLLGSLVDCMLLEYEIDYRCGGSSTLKRQDLDRGIEPDECYWIEHWQDFHEDYELALGPPPDLALEVEVSRSVLGRMQIYQAFGVPELWRLLLDGTLQVYRLDANGVYVLQSRSGQFPDVPLGRLEEFLRPSNALSTARVLKDFRAWLATL